MLTLNVEKRKAKGNIGALRKAGKTPAVFYGPKSESTSVELLTKDFLKIWKEAGETTVVTLKGEGVNVDTLIKDVTIDPVKDVPLHVDFYAIDKDKKIEVAVPVEFVGVSPAVKDLGGTLVKVLHEIQVESAPQSIPHKFEVDISALVDFEAKILVKDIKMPSGVVALDDAEEIVALATPAKEEEETPAPEFDPTKVELSETKGKKDEEGNPIVEEPKKEEK